MKLRGERRKSVASTRSIVEKSMRTFRVPFALFCCVSWFAFASANAAPLHDATRAGAPARKSRVAHVPAKGSAERKAILNAYRAVWLKNSNYQGVVFVVDYLKAHGSWAFLRVSPQSPDGKNHYESEGGLLQKVGGRWRVLERTGGETKCDLPCMKRKHPAMPSDIYPK